MKLEKFVNYLKTDNIDLLFINEAIEIDRDFMDIYMRDTLDLNSDLFFFDVDKVPRGRNIEIDGLRYVNLFPLSLAKELVDDFSKLPEYDTDLRLAKRLLEYRLNDA